MQILDEFKARLDTENDDRTVLPKSPIRAALTYMLDQWDTLRRCTEGGSLRFDSNVSERLVEYPAIGR